MLRYRDLEQRPSASETWRTMKLVLYTDSSDLGGAEASAATLLGALPPSVEATVMGVDSRVVGWISRNAGGVPTCLVPPVRTKRDAAAFVAHVRAVRSLRPDVFQANLISPWACRYGILAALLTRGIRVVAVEHLPSPTTGRLQRVFKRLSSPLLAAHVAVGASSAREAERLAGRRPGSVAVVYNGVPDRSLTPVERPATGPIVGSLGRLDAQKGYDVLVRALPLLPGVTAVLVGEGPEREALQRAAAERGVGDRVLLVGQKTQARDQLTCMDVFVLPSLFEGFPLSIVEAMLAGLPVVASDVGSVSEAVVEGETGLLIPPGDSGALAEALRTLLDDSGLRERLGKHGRARALERFTPETMARAFETLWREALR